MAGQQKGGKSGALDAFWDTYSSTSTTSGSMADLLSSLPGSQPTKAPQKKERPVQPPATGGDPILLLVKALFASPSKELTLVEILKQTGIGPSTIMEVLGQAANLGLVQPNMNSPDKSYRLTPGGIDFGQGAAS